MRTDKYLLILTIIFTIFTSCTSKKECAFGSPTPIFKINSQEVVQQKFSKKGQLSTEEIEFQNGLKLVLHQSGCEKLEQVFEFKNSKAPKNIQGAIALIIQNLDYFSSINDRYLVYKQWGSAIEQNKDAFKKGNTVELAPNFTASIDFITGVEPIVILKIAN